MRTRLKQTQSTYDCPRCGDLMFPQRKASGLGKDGFQCNNQDCRYSAKWQTMERMIKCKSKK